MEEYPITGGNGSSFSGQEVLHSNEWTRKRLPILSVLPPFSGGENKSN